jgi:hypothetical protein
MPFIDSITTHYIDDNKVKQYINNVLTSNLSSEYGIFTDYLFETFKTFGINICYNNKEIGFVNKELYEIMIEKLMPVFDIFFINIKNNAEFHNYNQFKEIIFTICENILYKTFTFSYVFSSSDLIIKNNCCANCSIVTNKLCKKCHKVYFCSKDCIHKQWKQHKQVCCK